jgi:hypothetical protein
MGLVEPHTTDEGKWQATFNTYGHGEGQGKSRNGVYKHANSLKKKGLFPESQDTQGTDIVQDPESTPAQNEGSALTLDKGPENSEIDDSEKEATASLKNGGKNEGADFVQNEVENWGSIGWADDEPSEPVTVRSIPKPLSDVAKGKQMEVNAEAMASMIRFSYVALDRMVTHWGRGVMNKPEWSLDRVPEDYDALEASTVAMMNHYGIEVPISPVMVWGATVGAAYGPPLVYVQRNADPDREKKGRLRSFFTRFLASFKRKKATLPDLPMEGEPVES